MLLCLMMRFHDSFLNDAYYEWMFRYFLDVLSFGGYYMMAQYWAERPMKDYDD
jgi:hypothetical protein